jgi:RNA 2',3'-cyclic 3'-phosphodiesterase
MRLFVALDLPDKVREALGAAMAQLRKSAPGARWVRTESMHVTLKFIGWVKPEQAGEMVDALGRVQRCGPIDLAFRGLGFFPNERRPRVLWCGIESSPNLAELAKKIEESLVPLGVEREKREFLPHLTLARFESPRGLEKLVRQATEYPSPEFGQSRETHFYLYESVLKPSGAEYKKFATFSLV